MNLNLTLYTKSFVLGILGLTAAVFAASTAQAQTGSSISPRVSQEVRTILSRTISGQGNSCDRYDTLRAHYHQRLNSLELRLQQARSGREDWRRFLQGDRAAQAEFDKFQRRVVNLHRERVAVIGGGNDPNEDGFYPSVIQLLIAAQVANPADAGALQTERLHQMREMRQKLELARAYRKWDLDPRGSYYQYPEENK